MARLREQARFRGLLAAAVAPRERALEQEIAALPEPALKLMGRHASFQEVPQSLVKGAAWRTVASRPFRRKDKIHNLEAASLTWTARRRVRDLARHGHRCLYLGDNMAVTCAVCKGRAAAFSLVPSCRTLAAMHVAADVRPSFRWIPSELNPSDAASRRGLRRWGAAAGPPGPPDGDKGSVR